LDLWLAALIIVGAAALSAGVMLFVRRRAPAGTYFKDVVPAGAVYTVVGTGYMVIVAFVFFVAFESYGAAKSSAEEEATATLAMFHAARLFGPEAGANLQGHVVCYAREVISDEWRTMRTGQPSPIVEARVHALEDAEDARVTGSNHAAALDQWLTLNEDRRRGRQGRIAEASPLVPPLIWLIIILGGAVVIFTVCLFADAEERRLPQGSLIAAVAVVVVSGLILVRFLDKPYENKSGSIKPTAMTKTLTRIEREHPQRRAATRCSPRAGWTADRSASATIMSVRHFRVENRA
jgi:hypothetical protein